MNKWSLWAQHIGRAPSPGLQRKLLVRVLEYKIGEQVYGGLRPHIRARLREIAESLENEKPAARWHRRMTEEEVSQELALLPRRSREELQRLIACTTSRRQLGAEP